MCKSDGSYAQRPSLAKRLSFRSQPIRRLRQLHHIILGAFALALSLYAFSRRNASPASDWRHPEIDTTSAAEPQVTSDVIEPKPMESLDAVLETAPAIVITDDVVNDHSLLNDTYDDLENDYTLEESEDDAYDIGNDGYSYEDDPDYDVADNHEIFSVSTRLRKPLPLFFDGVGATDPSIIPHPMRHNEWLIVAKDVDSNNYVYCPAGILEDVLICSDPFTKFDEDSSILSSCATDEPGLTRRVFYGPNGPYTMSTFGSKQQCTGSWLQDARMNLDAFRLEKYTLVKSFREPGALTSKRVPESVDTNGFIFWDSDSNPYVQQSLWPTRKFAAIAPNGHLGPDLASNAARGDRVCMAKYMPSIIRSQAEHEDLQQATNSLSITLCKRKDHRCTPSDSNTVLMHVVQKMTNYDGHAVAEPYVVLFNRTAPFALHAIAEKPFWIHGRGPLTNASETIQYEGRESEIPQGHTEMYNVASISWKTHGLKYHGYIDDVLFIGFGIERSRGGAIDVEALDLLQDMSYC